MKTYLVCDIDGFVAQDSDAWLQHFTDNPTHTSHIGVGGDSCSPVPYAGGSSTVPQVTSDPVSPSAGQIWVLANGTNGSAGEAMGVMGLTYSRSEVDFYELSFVADNGDIKKARLT